MNRELLPSLVRRDPTGQTVVPMDARLDRPDRLDWRRVPAESLVAVDDALDSVPIKATSARRDHYVF
jgi:hypothetical protein